MMSQLKAEFRWCRSQDETKHLEGIFVSNLTAAYISHSELQGPRALTPTSWSPEIAPIIEGDLLKRIDQPLDAAQGEQTKLTAAVSVGSLDVGVFLVTFYRAAPVPFCVVEDMIIASTHRSHGIGHAFMEWISKQSRERGITRLFLESGIANERAHEFFEAVGFRTISIVMMKQLS